MGETTAVEHGMRTVRQRYQGTSFVNSAPKNSHHNENIKTSNAIPKSMKFITQKNPEGKRRSRQANRSRTPSHAGDCHQRQAGLDGSLGSGQTATIQSHLETDPGMGMDETEVTDFSWEMGTGGA
ncbi:hypothetical protein BB8028_0002g00390 [Beauveria bassiana]|uniref:Uncharacterized protein n=1 Tax=Beauveria bassiana TaxID=176275 RepID=A0A2S7Y0M0_BEABA|nr:hypothetical protein BB8028_0002g00390 [Beauveria bassiana]